MDHQGLGVAYVGQVRGEAYGLDESPSRLPATGDAERQDGPGAVRVEACCQFVVGVAGVLGVPDPLHGLVRVEQVDHPSGVGDVAVHPQRQGLHPLEEVEGVGGTHTGAEVAEPFCPGSHRQGLWAELLGEGDAVVADVWLGQGRELPRRHPVEAPAVDDDAADGDPVAAEELGGGVDDDVGPVLDGSKQVGGGEGRVHGQRQPVGMGDFGDGRHVEYLDAGVAEGFGEHQSGFGSDGVCEGLGVARVDEGRGDPEAWQREVEDVVGAAVDVAARDDVVAGAQERGDGEVHRRLPAGGAHGAHPTLECGNAFLEYGHGRI